MNPEQKKTFIVLRYKPETDDVPHFDTFEVPWLHETSVLDALNYIRDHFAPDLSYRSSCRMSICGSCGMMINGIPRLACKTFVRDIKESSVRIEPLENFPIERDLISDISDMVQKIESVKPYIVRKEQTGSSETYKQPPQQLEKYRQFAQCINCGCCYAACPQYKLNRDFVGPAALTLLYRYNQDNRDQGTDSRYPILNPDSGVWRCTTVGYCSDVCPKLVDPASAIQLGKEASSFDFLRNLLKRIKH